MIMNLQLFGSRGASSGRGGAFPRGTSAQNEAMRGIAERAARQGVTNLRFVKTDDGTGNIAFHYTGRGGSSFYAIDKNGRRFATRAYTSLF